MGLVIGSNLSSADRQMCSRSQLKSADLRSKGSFAMAAPLLLHWSAILTMVGADG